VQSVAIDTNWLQLPAIFSPFVEIRKRKHIYQTIYAKADKVLSSE
jgi:hypothetical protein